MAIYHLSVKRFSRSQGRSATAAAAYRSGEKILDTRTGEVHDYSHKGGVLSATVVLPKGAPQWAQDRAQLWNEAEQAETRKNSTVAREFEVALPDELNPKQRKEVALQFAKELVQKHGFAADVAIHKPSPAGDERNHHAHILVSSRRLGPEGFTEKTRELDDQKSGPELVKEWRERWAQLVNERLREHQRPERIDHRTLEAQGIEKDPGRHLGPAATGRARREQESHRGPELEAQRQEQAKARDHAAEQLRSARRAIEAAERELAAAQREAAQAAREEAQERARADLAAQAAARLAQLREQARLASLAKAQAPAKVEQEHRAAPQQTAPQEQERRTPQLTKTEQPQPAPTKEQPSPPTQAAEKAQASIRANEQSAPPQEKSQPQAPAPNPTKAEPVPQLSAEEKAAILARAREATAKRRLELEQEAARNTPQRTEPTKEQTKERIAPEPRQKAQEQPPAQEKPLDMAAGLAAARARFEEMKRQKEEQERAEKECAELAKKDRQRERDRGRDGPER